MSETCVLDIVIGARGGISALELKRRCEENNIERWLIKAKVLKDKGIIIEDKTTVPSRYKPTERALGM